MLWLLASQLVRGAPPGGKAACRGAARAQLAISRGETGARPAREPEPDPTRDPTLRQANKRREEERRNKEAAEAAALAVTAMGAQQRDDNFMTKVTKSHTTVIDPTSKLKSINPSQHMTVKDWKFGLGLGKDPDIVEMMSERYPDVPRDILRHLCRAYGTRITLILGTGPKVNLGQHFGAQLTEAEADYLRDHEWARTAEDVLFRRTKQGLHLSEEEKAAFTDWYDGQS